MDRWVVGLRKSGDTEWEYSEVETPGNETAVNATENHGDDLYMGELEFTGLKPGTKYEVTVATSNSFGLGQHGDLYTFSTKQKGIFCLFNNIYFQFLDAIASLD